MRSAAPLWLFWLLICLFWLVWLVKMVLLLNCTKIAKPDLINDHTELHNKEGGHVDMPESFETGKAKGHYDPRHATLS